MTSLLGLHLDKLPEKEIVPGGSEYQLQIMKGSIKPSKSSEREVIHLAYKILDHKTAPPVMETLCLPIDSDAEDLTYNFQDAIRNFMVAFGIDLKNPGDPIEVTEGQNKVKVFQDWKGKEGWAFLGVETYEGVERNKVSRYIKKA